MPNDLTIDDLRSAVKGPFSARFRAGACAVITGPSGIGKSLMLRMIADLDPNIGTVRLGDADRDAMPAPVWRRQVVYASAEPGWWAETVAAHVADPAAARRLFPDLGLAPALVEAPVAELSTGEAQRAALVRAVLLRPRFLLLDEPTAALDPETRTKVEALFARLAADGTGLVVVTHDAGQAERIADQRFHMDAAGLREAGA